MLEVEDVAHVGATPTVDRLVRVADDAQIAVAARQQVDELVLHPVGVLILVHEHVLPATLVVLEDAREALEELHGLQQDVAEVEGIDVDQDLLVGGVEFRVEFVVHVTCVAGRLRRQHPGVLPLVDAPAQTARIVDLGIEAVPPQRLLRNGETVRFVVDDEAAAALEVPDVAPQDADAHGVEGSDRQLARIRSEQLHHALAHLAGRLVGERDGEDALGRDAADGDQIGDATRQHPRLAAARSGQHEQRPLGALDSELLLGIETGENRFARQGRPPEPGFHRQGRPRSRVGIGSCRGWGEPSRRVVDLLEAPTPRIAMGLAVRVGPVAIRR